MSHPKTPALQRQPALYNPHTNNGTLVNLIYLVSGMLPSDFTDTVVGGRHYILNRHQQTGGVGLTSRKKSSKAATPCRLFPRPAQPPRSPSGTLYSARRVRGWIMTSVKSPVCFRVELVISVKLVKLGKLVRVLEEMFKLVELVLSFR